MTPKALIYPGRAHFLAGESGGGKTWVALHTCAETVRDGLHVIYIDLEDHPDSIVGRLKALGVDGPDILERFHYIQPQQPFTPETGDHLDQLIQRDSIAIVVIDSIGELLSLQGCKPNDDDDVARVYRQIVRRIAAQGPAVILIDHVPKSSDRNPLYGIGSQRKRAAIDGSAYMVETVTPFAAGKDGRLKLVTAKDRAGNFHIGETAAHVEIGSQPDGQHLDITVTAPPKTGAGGQRQTVNMARISDYLMTQPDRQANLTAIRKGAGVKTEHLNKVLSDMLTEGWITDYETGLGKAHLFRLTHPYDEDLPAPNQNQDV
jgi:AAA domain